MTGYATPGGLLSFSEATEAQFLSLKLVVQAVPSLVPTPAALLCVSGITASEKYQEHLTAKLIWANETAHVKLFVLSHISATLSAQQLTSFSYKQAQSTSGLLRWPAC